MKKLFLALAVASTLMGCARVENGEVGLRQKFDKTIAEEELLPGSFNQTIIGDVLHFQVRSIAVQMDDRTPQTADNSTLKDFDFTLIYEINPSAVSDLWVKQSRAFHAYSNGEYFLMFNYVANIANSAAFKAVRKYKALEVADNRGNIEQEIKRLVTAALEEEKLGQAITISQVQVRTALPADDIVASANAVVRATNELKAKTVEVQTAEQEAKRLSMLANPTNLEVMKLQVQKDMVQALRENRNVVYVIPSNMTSLMVK